MRSVLATLLVHADQVVPVSSLIRELWDEEPPVSCLTTLQTYILNLRKLLASATGMTARQVASEILVTRSGGYLFRTTQGDLDVHRFHQLVSDGRRALSSGDDSTALSTLSSALQLWRGPALVDVVAGRILEGRRQQFEESRLVVLEYLVDTQLRLGMYREVLTELAALTADNPYHEGLHAQYMRALYLNGRMGAGPGALPASAGQPGEPSGPRTRSDGPGTAPFHPQRGVDRRAGQPPQAHRGHRAYVVLRRGARLLTPRGALSEGWTGLHVLREAAQSGIDALTNLTGVGRWSGPSPRSRSSSVVRRWRSCRFSYSGRCCHSNRIPCVWDQSTQVSPSGARRSMCSSAISTSSNPARTMVRVRSPVS